MDEETHTYFFSPPVDYTDSAIYISVETYPFDFIPVECTTGQHENFYYSANHPVQSIKIGNQDNASMYNDVYEDKMPKTITYQNFKAGDILHIEVKYDWFDSPHKDYTVKVHSKMNLPITD